jgi:hypothetical protein
LNLLPLFLAIGLSVFLFFTFMFTEKTLETSWDRYRQ